MVEVRAFGSEQEMRTHMERVLAEANKGLAPQQSGIELGEHWIRFIPLRNHDVAEFGYVYSHGEVEAQCSLDRNPGQSFDSVIASEKKGFLFGEAWSALEPDGMLGSTHRSAVWPIEKRVFDSARDHRWVTRDMPEWAQILIRFAEMGSRPYRLTGL